MTSFLVVSCASNKKKDDDATTKAQVYYSIGTASLQTKDYTEALTNLLKAVHLSPHDSKIHTNLGMAYYFKKDKEKAKKHLKKALEISPKESDAQTNLASIYFEEGDMDSAESEYRDILKNLVYDKQFRTYYNLGLIELKKNDPDKARKYFKQSLAENENFCPSHYQLGILNLEQKSYDKAYKSFVEASKGTCYQNPAPQYYQGIALLKMNRYDEARIKMEEIMLKFPQSDFADMAKRKMKSLEILTSNLVQEGLDPSRSPSTNHDIDDTAFYTPEP